MPNSKTFFPTVYIFLDKMKATPGDGNKKTPKTNKNSIKLHQRPKRRKLIMTNQNKLDPTQTNREKKRKHTNIL